MKYTSQMEGQFLEAILPSIALLGAIDTLAKAVLLFTAFFLVSVVVFLLASVGLKRYAARLSARETGDFLFKHRFLIAGMLACVAYRLQDSFLGSVFLKHALLLFLSKVVMVFILLLGTFLLFRLLHHYEVTTIRRLQAQKNLAFLSLVEFLVKGFRVVIWLPWIFFLLLSIGIDLRAILALGGVGSLVAGWAAKDLLANAFGMMTVLLSRYFVVGDLVRIGGVEGRVLSMDWRVTKIRSYDGAVAVLPNSYCAAGVVVNLSVREARLFSETLEVKKRYEPTLIDAEALDSLVNDLSKLLGQHPHVVPHKEKIVRVVRVSSQTAAVMVSVFLDARDYQPFCVMREEIWRIIGLTIREADYLLIEK